jgi:hypothetical protein
MDKKNHKEKINGDLSPYSVVEHYGEIEDTLWDDSHTVWMEVIASRF